MAASLPGDAFVTTLFRGGNWKVGANCTHHPYGRLWPPMKKRHAKRKRGWKPPLFLISNPDRVAPDAVQDHPGESLFPPSTPEGSQNVVPQPAADMPPPKVKWIDFTRRFTAQDKAIAAQLRQMSKARPPAQQKH
jgi:hypothetical protein